ncbi:MAG: PAS-domain containing protein [Alphaproteobacteria bacterium]|nr:PAS-domain containing protein [Alphaproteobacteria bacterium]
MVFIALALIVVALGLGYVLAWRTFRRRLSAQQAPALVSPEESNGIIKLKAENDILKLDVRRYANVFNITLNAIWQRDPDQNIIFYNLAFSEIAESVSDDDADVSDLELYKGHRQLAKKAWETGEEQHARRHIIVNGERRLFSIREVPMKSEQLTVGFAVDITELEQAHEEIQRHISAQRDLLESSTSAMAVYGKDQRLKFYNFAFVTLWKLDESWLDTEPTYGEVLEALREKRKLPEQANFQAFKQHQVKQFTALIEPQEEFFYLPDGKILRAIAIPHALGGILFVYEDVTDRLALERSYNTLIAVQRETLDNLHEGVVVFGENGRLKLCNPTFLKLWNLSEEFTENEPHVRDVLEQCKPLFITDQWETFKMGLVGRFQQRQFFAMRFERSNNTIVDCSVVPLPDGATLLTFIDMTDSSLVERSLREKADALEAADKLKTEFLANMSYELRSPLTSISGFAEMLDKEYVGALNVMQKDYVGGIFQSAQSLGHLISDIIDLATIEAGYLKLDVTQVNLHTMMDGVMALLSERVKLQEVLVHVDYARGADIMFADETRLKQVVFKLISNAVKYTKSKGNIWVDWNKTDDGTIELTVRDDGIGIEPSKQANVFDPFFRGVTSQGGNTGLGLSIVKRFVQLHGGSIALESSPSDGTRVVCTFPQQVLQALAQAPKEVA